MDKRTGKRRIWIYKDKITGKGKGEATITYDDPPTASSAINWFGGKIVNNQNLVFRVSCVLLLLFNVVLQN